MNTSSLKTFAQGARRKLRQQVGMRLDYWVGSDSAEHRQFAPQIKVLGEALRAEGREGLIERVAYTWFNRLAALRYMDANGFHSFGARVITPATEQQTLPELLQQARGGNLEKELRVHLPSEETFDGILSGAIPVGHPEAEALRLLIFAVCHYYHGLMPFLFEPLGDATELLLPADLLSEHSIIADFRENLPDADCLEVEVIGWLYQFYIAEKKDAVMARKSAVPTEDIPAVTQLFTPHWIVRYLVENSLGRLWLLNRPGSRLREQMPYFIEGEAETDFLKITKPDDIRLCDPAVGSGHMLTYAFDLLYLIYEEEGYDAPEIPSLILRHNLYGLEICPRAAALAAFALTMKARSRDTRFFRRLATGGAGAPVPQVIELQDIRFAENELGEYIRALDLGALFQQPVLKLLHQFEEAKNFGSLIQPCLDERAIADLRRAIKAKELGGQLFLRETHLKVLRVLEQAEALTQRYHVVVANPPYMGSGNFNPSLRNFLEPNYKVTRTDLFAIFLERNFGFIYEAGFLGMVTMQSWMFTTSYLDLREKILTTSRIGTLAQLGARAFDSISGEIVATVAFCITRGAPREVKATFIRLTEGNAEDKHQALLSGDNRFSFDQREFKRIPGSPMVYWKGFRLIEVYEQFPAVGTLASFREGIHTGDNPTFLRQWWEVPHSKMSFNEGSYASLDASGGKWIPYNKGGGCVRWYGNFEYVLAFNSASRDAMALLSGHVRPSQSLYFKRGGTWSDVGTKGFGVKYYPEGFLFADKGPVVVGDEIEVLIAGLNSSPFTYMCELLMPTISYRCGTVKTIPFPTKLDKSRVTEISSTAIDLARSDWDNFEASWDFRDLPLLRPGLKGATLEASWRSWEAQSESAVRRMQELEFENNRLFIAAYGLDGELRNEVPEAQITLCCNPASRYKKKAKKKKKVEDEESDDADESSEGADEGLAYSPEERSRFFKADTVREFLSYAVGCMMGRYSLDRPGLILADAGDTLREFEEKVGKPLGEVSFVPDEDGIIPVLGGEWFGDDIVARVREFVRVVYGEGGFGENVKFIEASLGKDLRKYFSGQFYKDHVQTYKKRPIYWMVSSPEGSFQALIYLHRYTKDTLNVMLDRYVRGFIDKLEERQRQLMELSHDETKRAKERTDAQKEAAVVLRMVKELREWDRAVVLPLAQQRIELDLDDGVKVNYQKFPGLLVKIPGLEKKEEE